MLKNRRAEPIDEARSVSFFATEHLAERALNQFLRRDTYGKCHGKLAQIRCQTKESGIHSSRSHNGNIHTFRLEFVPNRLGEVVDKRLR